MSATRIPALVPGRPLPGIGWWLLLGAMLALHLSLALGWLAALGLLAFVLLQRWRPLDFTSAYLMVVAGASVVNYGRGALTFELSILSGGILFMLFCYWAEFRDRALGITHARLTLPLALFVGLTCVNFVRGGIIGNSMRFGGLELIAALALGSAALIARREFDERFVRTVLIWLWIICLAHMMLGIYAYAALRVRTGSIYYQPTPGVVLAFMLNFALRARSRKWSILGLLSLMPMLLHQFLSFTRGFWFAAMAATLFSILVYTGRGPGVGKRWTRALTGLAVITGLGIAVAVFAFAVLGLGDIAEIAGSRFASSTGTEMSWETGSNIVRLVEYFHVLGDIAQKPWFGWGLGYYYVVQEPIGFRLIEKWYCHQNYLLITLKQGLLGLALFVWVLIAAFRTGWGGRRAVEPWRQAWCTGTAAATLWLILYSNVHFPLAEVNTVFTTALIWGGAMSMTRTGRSLLRWRRGEPAPTAEDERT